LQQKGSSQPSSGGRESLLSSDPKAVEVPSSSLDSSEFAARYTDELLVETRPTYDVAKCTDGRVRRTVAMKTIARECAGDSKARRRFLREARIQGQLEHSAIVPVYDLGVTPDGREYFTMQTVSGKSLRVVLDGLARGEKPFVQRFSRDRLMDVFQQLCLAVDYIHERGVVHRNLSPSTVLLGDFGEVYVTDWSIARVAEASSRIDAHVGDATLRGRPTGTPGYASPEQLTGDPTVDRRSDVYALGAILFELLTLEPLHPGGNARERLKSTLSGGDARASVRARKRDIPSALDVVCVKATAALPSERYATARELLEAAEGVYKTDRDFENRRRLAERHAELAEAAAVRAIVGTLGSEEQRRVALGEAGRALALDPASEGARRAVATLIREPMGVVPAESRQALEAEQAADTAAFGRVGFIAYSCFALVAIAVVLGGVLSWTGFLMILGPLAICVALCLRASRVTGPAPKLLLAIFAFSTLTVAAASGFYGALVLVPQIIVANTLALNAVIDRKYRAPMLAGSLLAISVPLALERLGLLPRAYEFTEDAITILPVVRELRETPVRLGLLISGVAAIIAPSLYIWKAHDSLATLSDALERHTRQLKQLLPPGAEALLSNAARSRGRIP
jgi:tRNA A-37 threonylcarbamoyl transferase component Bud32